MLDENTKDIITLKNQVDYLREEAKENREEIKEVKGWLSKVVWILLTAIIIAGLTLILRQGLI